MRLSSSDCRASATDSRASSIWSAAAARASEDATTSLGHLGLNPPQVDVRRVLVGRLAADRGQVDQAESPEVPEQAGGEVIPAPEVAQGRVRAPAECGPRVGDGEAGDERPEPRLLQLQHGRLDHVLGLGQFGSASPSLADQVIERGVVRDEPDDGLGRLDRGDHDVRVEHQSADEFGRGDLQLTGGGPDAPLAAPGLREDAAVVGLQARPGPGIGPREPASSSALPAASRAMASVPAACWRSKYASEAASRALFFATPTPGLVGGDESLRGPGLVDRVGEPQHAAQAVQRRVAASRGGAGKLFARVAVVPRESESRWTVWTWPLIAWTWPLRL